MRIQLYFNGSNGYQRKTFKNIQLALEESHRSGMNLYELDEDGYNLVYSNTWDLPTRRAVWRTLRSTFGLDSGDRKALPEALRKGTRGRNFEVN